MTNVDSFHYKVTKDENKNCNIDNEIYTRLDRKQRVVLSQLRCGSSPITMDYLYKINIEESPPICKACGDKNDSIEHMLQFCAMYTEPRLRIFGTTNISLDTLTRQPYDVIQYLKKIGRWTRPYRASQRP